MTSEERFEQMERNLLLATQLAASNAEALKSVVASQVAVRDSQVRFLELAAANQENLKGVYELAAANEQGLKRVHETLAALNESVTRYVDSADARMRRLEENLDALIRAITSEHSNGKGKN